MACFGCHWGGGSNVGAVTWLSCCCSYSITRPRLAAAHCVLCPVVREMWLLPLPGMELSRWLCCLLWDQVWRQPDLCYNLCAQKTLGSDLNEYQACPSRVQLCHDDEGSLPCTWTVFVRSLPWTVSWLLCLSP